MTSRQFLAGRSPEARSAAIAHPLILGLSVGLALGLTLGLTGCASGSPEAGPATGGEASDRPPLVQAGAPGEDSRPYDATSLEDVEGLEHTPADVAFVQGMIHHHAQALEMTALVQERTRTDAIRQMGLRMEISQADEIRLMERWLRNRGEAVPRWRNAEEGHGAHHGAAGDAMMPGMLTAEQMARLEAARDEDFDRLFLELMIQHHEGALVMVQELFATPGAGQESQIFQLAHEVDADQAIEIRRMHQILETLP